MRYVLPLFVWDPSKFLSHLPVKISLIYVLPLLKREKRILDMVPSILNMVINLLRIN